MNFKIFEENEGERFFKWRRMPGLKLVQMCLFLNEIQLGKV